MANLGMPALVAIFGVGAAVTWIAGIYLARATDDLDERFGLGEAMGGMILLAIAGSLPELAITVSGAVQGHLGLVAGNLIGGIAMQTMVLAICDLALRGKRPLSYLVASLGPVLEALLVILVVANVVMGAFLPPTTSVAGVSPASLGIVLTWVVGMVVLNRTRQAVTWSIAADPAADDAAGADAVAPSAAAAPAGRAGSGRVIGLFALASLVTLVAGVALEMSGNAIANGLGINGVVFGATVLALATALPEISTGVAAVRMGRYNLAMGDIFGGNAFQVCLFLLADLLAGQPVLPDAGIANEWLAVLGILVTGIYAFGVVVRPSRRRLRLGADSIVVLATYAVGMIGLYVLAQ
jgi:cation:H+ antiporter